MKRPSGLILWAALAIEIAAIAIAKPELGFSWWLLILAGLLVQGWLAWHLSIFGLKLKTRHGEWIFNTELNHVLASIAVVLGVLGWRIGKRLSAPFQRRRRELVKTPVRLANRNLDVRVTHPKLTRSPTKVVLGYNARKRPIIIDLAEQHTLVGASTKGGKTFLIRGILIQLAAKPKSIRPIVYVVDLKHNVEDGLSRFSSVFHYVREPIDAIKLLIHLLETVEERQDIPVRQTPIILVIYEVADLTSSTTDKDLRKQAEILLAVLARKARSASTYLVLATQHPRFDTLKKSIANNLLRKICMPVASRTQAEVVLEHRPNVALPARPGEFLLWEGLRLKRGRTLTSRLSEIDEAIMSQFEDIDDQRILFWKLIAAGKQIGNSVPGQARAYKDNREGEWCTQPFVRAAYGHYVKAGLLTEPRAGAASKLAVSFLEGVTRLKKYIGEDKWDMSR